MPTSNPPSYNPTRRQTRSSTRKQFSNAPTPASTSKPPYLDPVSSLTLSLPIQARLRTTSQTILLRKQTWLKNNSSTLSLPSGTTHNPIPATLIFAQSQAGTAVCISPNGVLLTCAHCIAETAKDFDPATEHWLLFANGELVCAKAVAWDPKRDLALLLITEACEGSTTFPFVPIASTPPKPNSQLFCIGHPGSEDLETSTPNTPTNYDTLVVSTGTFRGLAAGQDVQDNSEIGALKHSCWTYWGHSGAPLVQRKGGRVGGIAFELG